MSSAQPLYVGINKPFKNYERKIFQQHLDANVARRCKIYSKGKKCLEFKIGRREIKRVKKPDLIKYSFKKCGLSNVWKRVRMPLLTSRTSQGIKFYCPKRSSR